MPLSENLCKSYRNKRLIPCLSHLLACRSELENYQDRRTVDGYFSLLASDMRFIMCKFYSPPHRLKNTLHSENNSSFLPCLPCCRLVHFKGNNLSHSWNIYSRFVPHKIIPIPSRHNLVETISKTSATLTRKGMVASHFTKDIKTPKKYYEI